MPWTARGWTRTARALLFAVAVAAVALAAVAHVLGDAMAPSWGVVAGAVVVVFAGARAGAARERSFAALGAAMLAVQTGLHVVFMLLPGRMATGPGMGSMLTRVPLERLLCTSGAHAQAMRAAMTAPAAQVGGIPTPHLTVFGSSTNSAMLAGHLLAALALAWCLRCGEAAVWSLARLPRRVALQVLRLLGALLGPVAPARICREALRRCERQVRRLRSHLLRHVLALRGPPLPA